MYGNGQQKMDKPETEQPSKVNMSSIEKIDETILFLEKKLMT